MKKNFLFLLLNMLLLACNSDLKEEPDVFDVCKEAQSFKMSPDEAKKIVIDLLTASNSRNGNSCTVSVDDVKAVVKDRLSRSLNMNTDSGKYDILNDTLMYAVNLSGNQGFVLVAGDKRTEPVFAIIDEGRFDIDSLEEGIDEGFLSFVDMAVGMELKDIEEYSDKIPSRTLITNGIEIMYKVNPLLNTKWGQTGIYGKYCPNGTAGCVPVAVAQILSYYKTPNHVYWQKNGDSGECNIYWDQILSDCETHDGKLTDPECTDSGWQVGFLLRYLGVAMDAEYKSDGETGVENDKPIKWFNNHGLKARELKDFHYGVISTYLVGGNPIYARGNSGKKTILGIRVGYKGGHAWVYDGYLVIGKDGDPIDQSKYYFHCNWGWDGRKNGFYLCKVFNTAEGAPIHDSSEEQSSGTGNYKHYKYNLQYSIIEKE
ncbi:MAG: C10 family peptidase [Muribaculaceae bacterium]|nr:C10 family peptidase [Muribaculaceae bacterium]